MRVWPLAGVHAVLTGASLFCLLPVYVLVVAGLKRFEDVSLVRMWELPNGIDLGSFAIAWSRVSPNFWNSLQIAIPAALITALVGSLNGYIFAKWRFRDANALFTLGLLRVFVPYPGILIPLVLTPPPVRPYASIPGPVPPPLGFLIPLTP